MTPRHRLLFGSASLMIALSTFVPFSDSASPWTPAIAGETPSPIRPFADLHRLADADLRIQLSFRQVPIERILEAIEKTATPLELRRDESLRVDQPATIEVSDSTLAEALARLAVTAGLRYEVIDPHTVIVRAIRLAGTDGVTNPVLIPESKVQPAYPEEMRRQGVTAEVILQAVIDEQGEVTTVELMRNSEPDHPEFVDSATTALRQWRYEPATLDGRPVQVYFTVFVEFALHDGPDREETPPHTSKR